MSEPPNAIVHFECDAANGELRDLDEARDDAQLREDREDSLSDRRACGIGEREVRVAQPRDHHARAHRDEEAACLLRRLFALRVERAERLGGGHTGREFELLDVDHLPLHRDGHHGPRTARQNVQPMSKYKARAFPDDNSAACAETIVPPWSNRRRMPSMHRVVLEQREVRREAVPG